LPRGYCGGCGLEILAPFYFDENNDFSPECDDIDFAAVVPLAAAKYAVAL